MATPRPTPQAPRLRHCDDCDQDYETRDRLCPTCGAAFASTATSSTQPDPWFAGSYLATDGPPMSREEREAQQRQNDAAWFEGSHPDLEDLPEAMQQRILELINGQGLHAEGGEGGPGRRNGLSEEDIARLPLSQLHTTSSMLMSGTYVFIMHALEMYFDRYSETRPSPLSSAPFIPSTPSLPVTITLDSNDGQRPLAMECIPGAFSPVPPEGLQFSLIQADPLLADTLPLRNHEACRGKVIVTQRGKQTFGAMLVAARAAGALGVVVVDSVPLWPYLMRDGKGEAKVELGREEEGEQSAACFIVMVSQAHGEELLRCLAATAATTTAAAAALTACLAVSQVEKECLICISAFEENDTILRLPCQHTYHEECAKKWLNLQRTCPACRMEVKPRRES